MLITTTTTTTMCLMVVIVISVCTSVSNNCARSVMWRVKTSEQFDKDASKYVSKTKISFSIGMHETVCFNVEGDTDSSGRNYYITLDDVMSVYNYKNAYTFAMATPSVKCLCDCPGIENHCSPARDNCKEDGNYDSTCFNYFSDDQSTRGCGITSFFGNGEVCCSVSVRPAQSGRKYTAFEVSSPLTRAVFTVEKDAPYESRHFTSDLGTGSPYFDGDIQISLLNSGSFNSISSGWYFGEKFSNHSYTNVDINGLLEWNVNKLGWYKFKDGRFTLSKTAVKNSFSSHTINCDTSDLDVFFYSESNLTYAKLLEEFYASTIESASRVDEDRTLTLKYHDFARINVFITVEGKRRVMLRYDMPAFLDFTATAMFDRHSNRFLNISIINGKGTLHGVMKLGDGGIESNFDFIIPDEGKLINYTNYVQISDWCGESMVVELCFHAGDRAQEKCKVISCLEEQLMDFILPDTAIAYEKVHKPNFFGLETWRKYVNPLEWFNGIDTWQEGVIMFISLFLYAALASILLKICRCFKCGAQLTSRIVDIFCSPCCFTTGVRKIRRKLDFRRGYHDDMVIPAFKNYSFSRRCHSLPNPMSPGDHSVISVRSSSSLGRNQVYPPPPPPFPRFENQLRYSKQHSLQSYQEPPRDRSWKRMVERHQSYSDTDLLRDPKSVVVAGALRNEFMHEYDKRKFELLEQMIHEYSSPRGSSAGLSNRCESESDYGSSRNINQGRGHVNKRRDSSEKQLNSPSSKLPRGKHVNRHSSERRPRNNHVHPSQSKLSPGHSRSHCLRRNCSLPGRQRLAESSANEEYRIVQHSLTDTSPSAESETDTDTDSDSDSF